MTYEVKYLAARALIKAARLCSRLAGRLMGRM